MRMVRLPIHRSRHRGFNFAEVLFAVMILGVGFIMVAAIFPVAIQQSKTNTNETVAARVAEAMVAVLRENATNTTFPVTGSPATVSGPPAELTMRLMRSFIFSNDPRFGCTVLYRRDPTWGYAQVFVVPMQVNNRPAYTSDDLLQGPDNPATFNPIGVYAQLLAEGQTGRVEFSDNGNDELLYARNIATDGTVLITASGRIYRLGQRVGTSDVWNLALGNGLNDPAEATSTPVNAYLIGRGHDNPGVASPANYTGTNQVITVYTALIPIRQ